MSDFNTFQECVNYVVNMTDEQIREMSNEPIYINDDYNKKNDNKILNEYININIK